MLIDPLNKFNHWTGIDNVKATVYLEPIQEHLYQETTSIHPVTYKHHRNLISTKWIMLERIVQVDCENVLIGNFHQDLGSAPMKSQTSPGFGFFICILAFVILPVINQLLL